jgi:6-pyruvoyltetrahydropterin/6-carboxytetrahydropterin synthase
MDERYEVRVTKDFLVFSAAHFITFAGKQCERLHGHNYRVEVEAYGPLDENYYVIDFIALRDLTKEIVDRLDHRVLLPTKSTLIHVTAEGEQVTARFENRLWSFPREDCYLLPIPNTTAFTAITRKASCLGRGKFRAMGNLRADAALCR